MAEKEEQSPVDQLVDLLVYAPVGMLYEYQNVLPKLVRRGKSQVQLAKVVGQLAVNRGKDGPVSTAGQVGELVSLLVVRGITDLGEAIGLAPSEKPSTSTNDGQPPPPSPQLQPSSAPDPVLVDTPEEETVDEATIEEAAAEEERPLPIARYDELTAKVIIPLLDDLTIDQLSRIRDYEQNNRARKTVISKLDRLEN